MDKITLRNNVECTGMENMRSQFITICEQKRWTLTKLASSRSRQTLTAVLWSAIRRTKSWLLLLGIALSRRKTASVITNFLPHHQASSSTI